MTRKLNGILLALLIVFGLPFAWLMLDASGTGTAGKPVTMEILRRLAASDAGEPPREVRSELIGHRWFPSDLLAAGTGMRPVFFAVRAYQLVFADGRIIAIDRGLNHSLARHRSVQGFDSAAQARVDRAAAASSGTLLLSRDPEHSGHETMPAQPERHTRPYAVAPGVVVIPIGAGNSGKRMVYVHLADGREVLFTGDVAPIHAAWEQQRPPARLITLFFVKDDRRELAAWLRTIDQLRAQAPALHIVSGHDEQVPRIVQRGFVEGAATQPSRDR